MALWCEAGLATLENIAGPIMRAVEVHPFVGISIWELKFETIYIVARPSAQQKANGK